MHILGLGISYLNIAVIIIDENNELYNICQLNSGFSSKDITPQYDSTCETKYTDSACKTPNTYFQESLNYKLTK